jgi:hypothetical protein
MCLLGLGGRGAAIDFFLNFFLGVINLEGRGCVF